MNILLKKILHWNFFLLQVFIWKFIFSSNRYKKGKSQTWVKLGHTELNISYNTFNQHITIAGTTLFYQLSTYVFSKSFYILPKEATKFQHQKQHLWKKHLEQATEQVSVATCLKGRKNIVVYISIQGIKWT